MSWSDYLEVGVTNVSTLRPLLRGSAGHALRSFKASWGSSLWGKLTSILEHMLVTSSSATFPVHTKPVPKIIHQPLTDNMSDPTPEDRQLANEDIIVYNMIAKTLTVEKAEKHKGRVLILNKAKSRD